MSTCFDFGSHQIATEKKIVYIRSKPHYKDLLETPTFKPRTVDGYKLRIVQNKNTCDKWTSVFARYNIETHSCVA